MADSDEDLDRWIDTLRGRLRPGPAQDAIEFREAAALREAVLRVTAAEEAAAPEASTDYEHGWQRLAFRLRREGLFGPRVKPLERRWVPAAAAAAIMAAVMANLVLDRPVGLNFPVESTEAPQLRSSVQTLQVQVPRPVSSAQRLAASVEPLGAAPKVYAFAGKAVVDLDVGADTLQAVRGELKKNGISDDRLAPGLLRVVFELANQSR